MTSLHAIADTTPNRSDLRLVVLAQWIRAGLDLIKGASTTGRGLVGGAVALWRLAQAVRLAILLAKRLKEAQGAPCSGAPRVSASRPASSPVPTWSLETAPLDDADLRRAMAELEAAIADALGAAPRRRLSPWDSLWDCERPARVFARASREARGRGRRPKGRSTPRLGLRPLRPPGPEEPCRRRWRTPGALKSVPTRSPPWRSGATRWVEP
jgi:hypothetical protein